MPAKSVLANATVITGHFFDYFQVYLKFGMTVKRTHVLKTALSLFHREGFSNVGVDRIVAESNTAKMTFYKYFPTKIRLIEECLKLESLTIQNSLNTRLVKSNTLDPLQKLQAIYKWHYEFVQTDSFNGSLFHKAAGTFLPEDGSIFEIIDQHKKWQFNLIKQQLVEFEVKQPEVLGSLLVNMLDGMLSNARDDHLVFNGTWPLLEAILMCHKTGLCS